MPPVAIRKFGDNDSFEALTELLHRAYAGLARAGLNFTATDQDVETTMRRVKEGECWIAESEGKLIGTIMLLFGGDPHDPTLYLQDGVAHFGQFGVEPKLQGHRIGSRLLSHVEGLARSKGAKLMALDTAEPATELVAYYRRRGYETAQYHQWRDKTYRSLVMAKDLQNSKESPIDSNTPAWPEIPDVE